MRFFTATALLFTAVAVASPIELEARSEIEARANSTTHFLFTFGDSYSQTGFNVTDGAWPTCSNPVGNPPFPGYTTDNGVNWIGEIVETSPSCTLNFNFAFGGATVNASLVTPFQPTVLSFIDQVTEFTNSVAKRPKGYKWQASNTAVAVWLGVNDVGNSFYYPNHTDILVADLNSYFDQLSILYDAGVRKFLLLTTPPTYRSPLFIDQGPASVKSLKVQVNAWNKRITSQAGAWTFEHPGANVDFLDTVPIFNYVLDHPHKYGAPNNTCFADDGTSCLWWNNYHPGQAIQKSVGTAAFAKLFGAGSLGLVTEV